VRNPWRQRIVIGWSGMRGAISLAIALTIPAIDRGHRLTEQPTLVFLTAVVVMATLIGNGLTLAPLIRVLGLAEGEKQRRREASARMKVTEAALARLDNLAANGEVDEDTANLYRQLFEMRLDRVRAILDDIDDDTDGKPDGKTGGDGRPGDTHAFRAELVEAQREKLAELYDRGKISDEIRRSISHSLDMQDRTRRYE
jgi:CPA1 family monovalent cation:H+ antiporter